MIPVRRQLVIAEAARQCLSISTISPDMTSSRRCWSVSTGLLFRRHSILRLKSRISSVLAEELRQTVALVPELDLAWPSISTDPDLHAGCVR